jgi:GMP synthase (glutamine-hydrolysing)
MIQIIDFGSSKTSSIASVVDEYMECEIIHYAKYGGPTTETLGIIFSGAPVLITEIDMSEYISSFSWIKETEIPILGICFGHQLIGLIYGANPSKQREDRDLQTIEFIMDHPLITGLSHEVEMLEDHCENISIPPGFDHLATSDTCINEGMVHKTKALFGVQFHPEVSGNVGSTLISNFIRLCD